MGSENAAVVGGFDMARLRAAIENAKEDPLFTENVEYWRDSGDNGDVWYLETIASGWEGSNQPETIVEYFGIDTHPEDEFVWDDIDAKASSTADKLNAACSAVLGDNLSLFFGGCDGDGSYCLAIAYVQ